MLQWNILITLMACTLATSEPIEGCPTYIENPVVATPLGQIKGTVLTSRLGKRIYSFRGIRYAKPPINELRFKPPEPIERWEGVYNATQDGPLCPQRTADPVSEDCLVVNVYSTKLPKGKENPKRPVIVFIHPGGYYSSGSTTSRTGPQYFLDQDIVLVTFNYRLGSLGFLSTGTKEAPGNNGLKDQVVLLKWVKQNIAGFGGDPDNVTIMGLSAGGRSVILHMISPMSQDLFHKAIAMSASPFGVRPVVHDQLDLAKKQARLVGCPDDSPANIISCLKKKPFKELGDSLSGFWEFGYDPLLIWYPVVENDFGQPRFLTAEPIHLIKTGQFKKLPFMTGVTPQEFGYRSFEIIGNETLTEALNNNFEQYAPIAFIYERGSNLSKRISKQLRAFYFQEKPIDQSQFTQLSQLYADSIVGFGVNRAAKLMATYSNAPVYYYRFNYQGRYSYFYIPGSNGVPYGVVHHDDLKYLFHVSKLFPFFNSSFPAEERMVEKMTTLYANFAKTGNPTPKPTALLDNIIWQPFTTKEQKYLDIDCTLVLGEKLYDDRYSEWEKIDPLNRY